MMTAPRKSFKGPNHHDKPTLLFVLILRLSEVDSFIFYLSLVTDLNPADLSVSIDVTAFEKSSSIGIRQPHSDTKNSLTDSEFASRLNARRSTSFRAVSYALTDLQSATGNFATRRLIGEGTIGRVYRAKYADGKVLCSRIGIGLSRDTFSNRLNNSFSIRSWQ